MRTTYLWTASDPGYAAVNGEDLLPDIAIGRLPAGSHEEVGSMVATQRFHRALLQELFHGNHERLGDAMLAAQAVYTASGSFPELVAIYHLFGDPALDLR